MKLVRFFVVIGVLFSVACRDKIKPKESTKEKSQPIVHQAKTYQLSLHESWTIEDPKPLNTYADFAASKEEIFFFLVIPQRLPELPNVPLPDALDLKRASVHVMEQEIDDFKVELQGPINIDDHIGQTVVASGRVEKDLIKYVTTYFAVGAHGYQIVAWGPFDRGDELLKEADGILATIRFTNASKGKRKPDGKPDAGSGVKDASTK